MLESVCQDAAYAFRNLRREPGFAAVVLLVLSTVIGLHTTLATVVAGVLLRPWPGMQDPERVVLMYLVGPNGQASGFSLADHRLLADRMTSLAGIATMTPTDVHIGSGSGNDNVRSTAALLVSANFFDLLGVSMARGRGFVSAEDRIGSPQAVAVLAYDFWQSRFGGDPGIVGQIIRVDDARFTIVGVSSKTFANAEPAYGKSLFLPTGSASLLRMSEPAASGFLYRPDYRGSDLVARLAPHVTRDQARAELDLLRQDLEASADARPRGVIVTDTAFASHPSRSTATQPIITFALVSAALTLVWLIACANIGNLLLARAAARLREIGIRLSLGASRRRILRQLLTEGFVIALGAGALGIAVAYELPFVILRVLGDGTAAFPFQVRPDGVVLVYAVLIAALSSIAFGLAPALHVTRTEVASALNLREGPPPARFALRGVLLAVQVAVSVILLVSAGLLVRGAQRQAGTFDPGFAVNDVTVVSFELPAGAYDDARKRAFFTEVAAALRQVPIDAFGFATWEPTFIRRGYQTFFHLPGQTAEQAKPISFVEVSAGYLGTLRIPIVAGRDFEAADAARSVIVINETMARQFWPNENPVGKTIVVGRAQLKEIVGVMRNAHTHSMYDIPPLFYQPWSGGRVVPRLLLRSAGPISGGDLARMIGRIDPRVRIQTMPLAANLDERLREARIGPFFAGVLGAFALALSTIGMFGVFAFAVRQRTREIGIRMALGAQPATVVRLLLSGHSRAVVAGLGVGLLGAIAASVVMRSRLHGMSPFDPIAYLSVAAILTVAGLAASYVPARRATRVDPVVALRHD